jgi:hypothetical protein
MTTDLAINAASGVEVPLLDLKAQYRELEAQIMEKLRSVCTSQQFILGAQVSDLMSCKPRCC